MSAEPKLLPLQAPTVADCGEGRVRTALRDWYLQTYRFTTVSMFASGTHRAMRTRCTHSANGSNVARVTALSLPKAK